MSLSEVESKERLWNPERVISCWLLDPGSWAKLIVKPRTQAIPTACKALLPGGGGDNTWVHNVYWERRLSTFLQTGVTVSPVTHQDTNATAAWDMWWHHYRAWGGCSSSALTSLRAMLISISVRGMLIEQGLSQNTVTKDRGYTLNSFLPIAPQYSLIL